MAFEFARSRLTTQQERMWRRVAILVLLCLALAALASSDTLHTALLTVLDASKELIAKQPVLGAILFVLVAAVSAMFAFVSVAVIVPVAVFAWGVGLSIALLWLGWILGGVCAYGIARFFGRRVVRWLTADAALRKMEARVQRNAPFGLILLVQLALPSEIPGYLLGLLRYRFLKYVLALGLAELPYALATVYLGQSFVQRQSGWVLALGISLAALSVLAFYILRKRLFSD